MRTPLFGRNDVIARISESALAPAAPPLVVIAGPIGVGRSSVLAAVRNRVTESGVATLGFQVTRNERTRPYAVAARLAAELGRLAPGERGSHRPGAAAGRATRPVQANRLAGALAAAAATHRRLVVFLDDIHWIDPESLAGMTPLVRTLVGTQVRFVCTLRSPMGDAAGRAAVAGLREAKLVRVVPLRPLREAEVTALLTEALQAKPSAELRAAVRRECRNFPSTTRAAVAGYQASGSLRVVDRNAYLTRPSEPPEMPNNCPPVEYLRTLGDPAWPVAKALAMLHPLGAAAPRLIAAELGISEPEVLATLAALRAEGIVLRWPKTGHWRFRLPLLATAVIAALGPYERRRFAQLAVTAIWAGDAQPEDERYLAEELVTAGKLVDPERAAGELLGKGIAAMLDHGYFAERWLRTAAELISEPAQRAWALFLHAATCTIHLRFAAAMDSAWAVLSGYADLLPPEAVLELEMIYIVGLSGTLDTKALTNIAEEGWRSLPGGEGHRIISRIAALCHLGRYPEADEQLRSTYDVWRTDNDAVATFGMIFQPGVAAFLGDLTEFNRQVADPAQAPLWEVDRHRFEQLAELSRILLGFGELDRCDRLLAKHELPSAHRLAHDEVLVASLAGRWDDALDLTRVSLATGSSLGYVPAHTLMCREASQILAARGRLTQAKVMIDNARKAQPVLGHVLAGPEAQLAMTLGDTDRARLLLQDALADAAGRGLVIGTDVLWLRMTAMELAAGDLPAARHAAAEVARVAERIGTGRGRLCQLLATAEVDQDVSAAAEAVDLARRRHQPFELASTLAAVAGSGLADAGLLLEAYDLYGELDALLYRAQLRMAMRARDVGVPGRQATVTENERLLAALVTEGLTNREMASVLGGSEKGVEGRLTRLFQRTGYRSRVELATAMLTGEYPA